MNKIISKKQQKMYNALLFYSEESGHRLYILRVPKRLYEEHKKAVEREAKGKKLSAMEKTRLYGYLNPIYRAATGLNKRIH